MKERATTEKMINCLNMAVTQVTTGRNQQMVNVTLYCIHRNSLFLYYVFKSTVQLVKQIHAVAWGIGIQLLIIIIAWGT